MKLLSPPGLAGVAILAVEPHERASILASLRTASGKPCQVVSGNPPMRAVLTVSEQAVDDVLVVCRANEDLELHIHGAPAVLDQLDRCFGVAIKQPASPAERLLRGALSTAQFALATEQIALDFDQKLSAIQSLPEKERRGEIDLAMARSKVARAMIEPERLVLIGQKNAGKSSLFNQLLFRERALTGATPGLTRDPVAEVTTLVGYPFELVDTAGEGVVDSVLDAEAIASGQNMRQGATLILVIDGAAGPVDRDWELAKRSQLVVSTKADLAQEPWPAGIPRHAELSAVALTPDLVRSKVGELLRSQRGLPPAGAVGGFAALDEEQHQLLIAAEADCS